MIFGHNTNLKVGEWTFHVQTEDRGEAHALIDTTVYYRGRVLHRRTNNYFDLMPLDDDSRQALKLRLDDQHRTVLEEIQSGKLSLTVPHETPPPPPVAASSVKPATPAPQPPAPPRKLSVELLNPKAWLSGKHASLHLSIKDDAGAYANYAQLRVEVEGAAEEHAHSGQADAAGQVKLEFDMPKISSNEAAIVIRAEHPHGSGHLRFALRAKPRVSSL